MPTVPQSDALNQVITRNVSEVIRRDELEKALQSGKQLKIYLGVDPSSSEIHLGHAVVLWKLRQFQDLGHRVILLIGDFTAQIGDPTGRSKERQPLTHEQVLQNARDYQAQASKILDFDGQNSAQIQYNSQWLAHLTLKDIIDVASHFTVQQMIERDMFQDRLKANQSIGLHEFLYPLMVGYDSVHLDVDVEIGGNDQLFNIKAGRTLGERMTGKKKIVLVCDLLTGSDGSKMSKSAGNSIPITATSVDMFGKLMAIDDTLITEYARLASEMGEGELKIVMERLQHGENPRDVKVDVAKRIVARYCGVKEADQAKQVFFERFSHQRSSRVEVLPGDETVTVLEYSLSLVDLVAQLGGVSKTEARRLIESRAVDVDSSTIDDPYYIAVFEEPKTVRIGKHKMFYVKSSVDG